ncbi:endo-1,3-beta-glucanase [Cellulomonas chitinilytica]|uniref:Endo-1,3-beta-glucanase n=1 Tax=Cellulomonas chitinilytica TaxID=398759 RepID=A0A919U0V1_9CELL|nr:ricin-type beta-trefoil lectin domain protein [Cellulomonas chitinilytica]GIG19882.1 endo-1,3-beta-glucanase [Cellulomonas chitinilytica]
MTHIRSSAHRRRLPRIALVATAVLAAALAGAGDATAAAPPTPSGWTQQFVDDFNGAANTGLNTANWLYDIGTGYPGGAANWGTGEVETMTNSTQNVYQDGAGNLVIKPIRSASGQWTSGRVETQRTDFAAPAGGKLRFEARLQQPNVSGAAAAGYWPAFWALGAAARGTGATGWPSIGEIDVMEDINGRSSEFAALHCGTNPGGPCNETTGITSGERACSGCQTGFHTYAVEQDRSVSPEQLRFYLDGTNFFTVNANQVDATTWNNATHHGFFMILNVAIGGGFPAAFGGGPTSATQSGVPMVVDYVAAYTAAGSGGGGGGGGGGTVTSGSITNANGLCLDNNAASTANGNKIQIWGCNGTVAQKWTFVEAGTTLHVQGKCLDIAGGGTANGTKVQLYDCNNTGAQVWIPRNGGYYNPQSNRCLDNPSASTTAGTQVQIWDCNGSGAQKWTLHS